jgi:hypothetical protein
MEAAGIEPEPKSSQNLDVDVQSGALRAREALLDPDLVTVMEAWPTLSDAIKAGILALVQADG